MLKFSIGERRVLALQHLAYEKELEKFTKLLVSGNLQSNETETASKLEKKEKNLLLSKMNQKCPPERLVIRSDNNNYYEIDRYCPHKLVDLAIYGKEIVNNVLRCSKHDWYFDLNENGLCHEKGKSLHAVCLGEDPKLD
ncbi:uncharacterized protein LOC135145692, partial [Zophobas morio]|uniref:uncharacterized protein LOC135145692 n=1 Tax=Zophobas morio TaxID=2755281 RepID=UPI003082E93D